MCMTPSKVIRLILEIQESVSKLDKKTFDEKIQLLATELKKVTDGEIDMDALVHSFL